MKRYVEAKFFISVYGTTLTTMDLEENIESILEKMDEIISENYKSSFERVDFEIDDEDSFIVYYEFRVSGIHIHLNATWLDPPEDDLQFDEEFDCLDKDLNKNFSDIKFEVKDTDNFEFI